MASSVSFQRVATGIFDVLRNGEKTKHQIVNGSLGLSGKDTPNVYGVTKSNGSVQWVGTLQASKKLVTYWLSGK